MADARQLSIRVPQRLFSWVRRTSARCGLSQQRFLVMLLEQAMEDARGPSISRDTHAEEPVSSKETQSIPFRFVDLFAGIGGFRLGLESAGGRCVFSCEVDPYAQKTYSEWFGETPESDIHDFVTGDAIPSHHVLAAGFPCQPFSIAGVSKKKSLGRDHGFEDKVQGTLFFQLAKIIERKQPQVLLLENVKNLTSHNKGNTWRTIHQNLEDLGYCVFYETIDAADYVPQHRERVFIVCFRRDVYGDKPPFEFPGIPATPAPRLRDVLQSEVPDKYTLTDRLWNYLQDYRQRHAAKGNGFGFGLADPAGITRTLSARYYKDGAEILIPQKDRNPRRLTPFEAARLMGFPKQLAKRQVVSDTRAYKQYGNAVVPAVAAAVAKQIVKVMHWQRLHLPARTVRKSEVQKVD